MAYRYGGEYLCICFLGWPNLLERILSRVLLMPVVAGIAYEVIRLAGRSEHSFVKAIIKPGLVLQYMTTREPEDDQIEVAIRALKRFVLLRVMHMKRNKHVSR